MAPPLQRRANEFLETAEPRLAEVQKKLADAQRMIKDIMAKYGEVAKSGDEDAGKAFFSMMTSFAKAFKQAMDENAKLKQDEEKKAAKKEAADSKKETAAAAAAQKSGGGAAAGAAAKPTDNIFGSFQSAQAASRNDIIAEFQKRLKK